MNAVVPTGGRLVALREMLVNGVSIAVGGEIVGLPTIREKQLIDARRATVVLGNEADALITKLTPSKAKAAPVVGPAIADSAFKCECGQVAKSAAGLGAHRRKHKAQ